MPNNYEATDPKTGQKWTWDGKKWNPVAPEGTLAKVGRGAALGAFSGAGIPETTSPVSDLFKGLYAQGKETLGRVGEEIQQYGLEGVPGAEAAHVGKSVIGNLIGSGKEAFQGLKASDPEETAHGTASLLTQLLMLRGAKETPEMAGAKSEVAAGTKGVLREAWGVGKRDVEAQAKKAKVEQADVHAKAVEKVEKAKDAYSQAVSDLLKKRAETSAKETAAKTKQEALASKHGPVYQRMNEMADTAQKHISDIEQKVGEAEGKKWTAFSERVGNPKVPMQDVADTITDVRKTILTGESVPVFNQIMNEIVKEDSKDFIDMASGLMPKVADAPLDLARRLYTKIGRKLGGAEMPRDVARALAKVSDSLDDTIARSVTEGGGVEALRDYRKLQADWKQYRETFSDKHSPLRKVVEAKDPSTKLGPITGETGARAIEYLGRYRNMGAHPEQLGKIRAINKALKELHGSTEKQTVGTLPDAPTKRSITQPQERPSLPKVPEQKAVSAEDLRREMLEKRASTYSGPPRRFELFIPPLYAFRMLLKKISQNPKFIDYLAKEGKGSPAP